MKAWVTVGQFFCYCWSIHCKLPESWFLFYRSDKNTYSSVLSLPLKPWYCSLCYRSCPSVVFNRGQKMALRVIYISITLNIQGAPSNWCKFFVLHYTNLQNKALKMSPNQWTIIYYFIKRSQHHLLATIENNRLEVSKNGNCVVDRHFES